MIHEDSIITLEDGWCTAKKVFKNKRLYKKDRILRIDTDTVHEMILVATEHYSIYVTPSHYFASPNCDEGVEAGSLFIGQDVMTATGNEKVILLEPVFGNFKVYNFITESGNFIANCFISLG